MIFSTSLRSAPIFMDSNWAFVISSRVSVDVFFSGVAAVGLLFLGLSEEGARLLRNAMPAIPPPQTRTTSPIMPAIHGSTLDDLFGCSWCGRATAHAGCA